MIPKKVQSGRAKIIDELFAQNQPELRKLAASLKRAHFSVTLNVTALVNEAYLKLRAGEPSVDSPLHLRRMAAKTMREILVDAARKRKAERRGGSIEFIGWDENLEQFAKDDRELLALDAALTELASLDSRQAEMVEAHFFGGLSWGEVAESLGVSIATVEREWRVVRAKLARFTRGRGEED